MKYTHNNGVTIERLESGVLEATHPDWEIPARSPDGISWAKRGIKLPSHTGAGHMPQAQMCRSAWYAFAGLRGEEGEGDAEPRSRYKAGALVVFANDTMTPIAGYLDTWDNDYAIISRTDTGEEYTVRPHEVIVIDRGSAFGTNGPFGIPEDDAEREQDAEPKTYTWWVETWPDGVYSSPVGVFKVVVKDGRGLQTNLHTGGWQPVQRVSLHYTRTGDFDPSMLFGGDS